MWFKFNWFKSKEREEIKRLQDENAKVAELNKALANELAERPYKNIYYSDKTATVVFRDGEVRTFTDVDETTYRIAKGADTKLEMIDILNPPTYSQPDVRVETPDEKSLVLANSACLRDSKSFEVKGNNIYLKGVSLPLPASVAASFIELVERINYIHTKSKNFDELSDLEDRFIALKMFWLKLALNPIESSRNDLLNFVRKNDVRITRNGNLVLYRRIVSLGKDKDYIEFVSQNYARIKGWKKSPKDYWVYGNEHGKYELHSSVNFENETEDYLGTLYDCYHDLPKHGDNEYTSAHNRGKHTIRIGEVYKIDEKGINLNNGLCAAGGLHAACVNYDYSGFGDTPVVVLVNPSKAITVPVSETGKLRTTEMFIACINDKPIGTHFDESALGAFDEEYNNISILELENAVAAKSFAVATVAEEVAPITFLDLEAIKNMLKERVKTI